MWKLTLGYGSLTFNECLFQKFGNMGKNIIFQIGNNSQELTLGLHIQWN